MSLRECRFSCGQPPPAHKAEWLICETPSSVEGFVTVRDGVSGRVTHPAAFGLPERYTIT